MFYLEACESGSMFDNFKIKDLYVTTASAPDESSYACYFDDKLGTFLGDVYSVRWMEDSDKVFLIVLNFFFSFFFLRGRGELCMS